MQMADVAGVRPNERDGHSAEASDRRGVRPDPCVRFAGFLFLVAAVGLECVGLL
jgi:hypothetical protein